MKTKKITWYVSASPSEFAIHRRAGRLHRVGRGISFLALPVIDSYYLIPSTSQSVGFSADQISLENQGVEVAGFAVWRINDPEKASYSFDFADSEAAMVRIGDHLRQVVESAIRHQVANMPIEDVLRKRGSIILALKQELAYMADQWGLAIETVEIRTVRVLSEQLFQQMQARFRDSMQLISESSRLETEKQLAERRLAQEEEIAQQKQEFEQRQRERNSEDSVARLTSEANVRAFQLERQRDMVGVEQQLHDAQAALDASRGEHEARIAAIKERIRRLQIESGNTEDVALALVKQLPAALGALQVEHLSLGDDALRSLVSSLADKLRRPSSVL